MARAEGALHTPGNASQPSPDPALLSAVARAWRWLELLTSGEAKSTEDLATRHGQDRGPVRKILNLAFLSPAIVRAIVRGKPPPGLRLTHLLRSYPWLGMSRPHFCNGLSNGIGV